MLGSPRRSPELHPLAPWGWLPVYVGAPEGPSVAVNTLARVSRVVTMVTLAVRSGSLVFGRV